MAACESVRVWVSTSTSVKKLCVFVASPVVNSLFLADLFSLRCGGSSEIRNRQTFASLESLLQPWGGSLLEASVRLVPLSRVLILPLVFVLLP